MANLSKKAITKAVKGKNIIITGASSGIGERTAFLLSECGAHVILLARTEDKLKMVKENIETLGGAASYYPCDLTNMDEIEKTSEKILADFKHVDVLVNNAGRSIRRSVHESVNRFHDFERTMEINYFGAVKIILGFLPTMIGRQTGQIVNISSIGVLANSPRFSAYVASKAALDAFSRCLAAEVKGDNIKVTNIFMPLVRTPMIAPTKLYRYMPALMPDEAAMMVAKAIVHKPNSIASNMGKFASATYSLVPAFNVGVQSIGYRIFPSSTAAQTTDSKPNLAQRAFAKILPGEHH
ncbi:MULTISPECIES: SDR family NAD(P)-dependent oxidoreductase [Psychrobacter]|jgi:short-subunit dehydrogenase|uniref:SDR family NAD(P)-dependent oxidoreductase n=2 Tax=Psychrobacter TaxID=497 RepID=A0ABV0D232_9GAMM|nr:MULTISPECIES: SDR family NAD(P)-dependent oxidoreductase [Psychrobacter]KRG36559.1 fatty acyl-CoA reductase [Psychrobacter sp. P11G3]MBA6245621.1 SDR family NAD(P)-dependent oxidoreductase [Psychrobacter sp. Urea-trap-18]MBA6286179.1 SDR family NAD(P)-dependent oxidoreductase [Psychrobacter sp. Urea-trap-16]MBA6318213.1 SDR family NAD(P)-dependent oxidoreductase [Psychrobacter sp. Urea-trap-20]MBA6334337.1 SDR family NAD(P)-dependent oxidoreductase [Psychrobacter sp. Urea-trap-19]